MSFVDYAKQESIAIVRLNRPDRLNALGKEVVEGLFEAWKRFDNDKDAKVLILTGEGRAFSAGADIKEMMETGRPGFGASAPFAISDPYGLASVTKPTIVAVNGFALGGGCHLAMAADIRIAAESASFALSEINVGIFTGGHLLISQQIPLCVIMEMTLTGDPIGAQRAYEVGIVNRVVPDNELMSAAMKMAEKLTRHSVLALKLCRQAVLKAAALTEEALTFGVKVGGELAKSEDAAEGVRAFMERRPPVYRGR
jgi:enoyl-CoA hydratase